MALSEKHRRRIYAYLVPELGEETASEMLSYFPARDVEEPVTKEYLKGEFALVRMELHNEISGLRGEMQEGNASLRGEMRGEISGLRTEMGDEISSLRAEMRDEISGLRAEVSAELRNQLQWIVRTQLAMLAIVVALVIVFA